MEKTSNWKIASILVANVVVMHWLVKSFGTNMMKSIVGSEKGISLLLDWPGTILSILGIILGLVYSRWYFSKKGYVIQQKSNLLFLSVVIFFVVILAINFIAYYALSKALGGEINFPGLLINAVIITIIFYLLAKVFIKETKIRDDISSNI